MARQNPMVILKALPDEHPSGFECGFLALSPYDLDKPEKKALKKALKEAITMQRQYQILNALKIW
jgi:hypothetical protein